ncbi:MAG: sulfur carrier protein ThiS [Phycisphaerales bacterium]
MKVEVNGDSVEVPEGSTVIDLVGRFNLASAPYAVELNREVLPRARHREQTLVEGDRIEIVTLVGGG